MNTREPSQGENRFWESRNTFECLNIIYYFIDINGKLRTIYSIALVGFTKIIYSSIQQQRSTYKKTDHSIVLKFDYCYNQLYFKLILLPLSFNELKALLCRSNRGMLCLSAADRDQQSLNEPTILATN